MNKNEAGRPKPGEDSEREETLAERSARLEAEAAAGFSSEDEMDALDSDGSATRESENAAIKQIQAELDQAKDQLMRALAEAENTRKRAARDREEASKYAISGFARDLLDVADNLRRAIDAVPDDAKSDVRIRNLVEGIEATERELLKSFEKNGIERLEPLGQPFNPNFHEVMFEVPGSGKPAGIIVQVVETGYTLHDRLLRPARVGVAKDEGVRNGGDNEPGSQIDTQA